MQQLKHIQIQTSSYCDGFCPYCPYRSVRDELPQGYMPDETVYKCIDEAIEMEAERIIPYLMNEPLKDERIRDFVEYIRNHTDTMIEISTNGFRLTRSTRKWLKDIENLLVILNLNQSTDEYYLEKFLRGASFAKCQIVGLLYYDYTALKKFNRMSRIFRTHGVKCTHGRVDDRAGNLDITDGHKRFYWGQCYEKRLHEWMHILWNGDVILCCQDWKRTTVLGNINDNSISEIFNGELYNEFRQVKPDLCFKCSRWIHEE